MTNRLRAKAIVLGLLILLAACVPTIAGYEEQAYRNATTLKAESHAVLATAATVQYPDAAAKVDRLMTDIDAAYNYADGIPKNRISATQWKLLRDGIAGRFFATWRVQGRLSPAVIVEDQAELDKAFDQIICLEANKKAAASCRIGQGATP